MSELVVLMGPPASGKTTYAHKIDGPGRTVISVDDARDAYGIAPGGGNYAAFVAAYQATRTHLDAGRTVIFDSTAITPNVRRQLRRIAKRRGIPVRLIVVHAEAATCRARNARRSRPVPAGVLEAMLRDYESQYPIAVGRERWSSVRVIDGQATSA